MVIFKSAEEAAEHVNATVMSGNRFELAISDDFIATSPWSSCLSELGRRA
jgi:hypothetical protein